MVSTLSTVDLRRHTREDVAFSFCGTTVLGWLMSPEGPWALAIFVNDPQPGLLRSSTSVTRSLLDARVATLHLQLEPSNGSTTDVRRVVNVLIAVIDRVRACDDFERLPFGLVGVGIGAAAALWTASLLRKEVGAVISIDGRPDLAERHLNLIEVPTLLVVDARDTFLFEVNSWASPRLRHGSLAVVGDREDGWLESCTAVGGKDALGWFEAWLLAHGSGPPSWLSCSARS